MNTHDAMKVVKTNYTVATAMGTYVFSMIRIKGLRLRKPVYVRSAKAPSHKR